MLKLTPRPTAPRWIDLLPGVRVQVRPLVVVDHLRARDAAAQVYRDDPRPEGTPASPEVKAEAAVAMVRSFAHASIVGWDGVGDAEGAAIEPTPEAIDHLLSLIPAFEAFDALVVIPALNANA